MGSSFPNQGSSPCPRQWKRSVNHWTAGEFPSFLYFSVPRHCSKALMSGIHENLHFSSKIEVRIGCSVTPPCPSSDLGWVGCSWSVLSHHCYKLSSHYSVQFVIGDLLILLEKPGTWDSSVCPSQTQGYGSILNSEFVRTGMSEEVFGQSFCPLS